MRAEPPGSALLGAPGLAAFALGTLGALGGCGDSPGRLWPAGRVAGCPCWALREARGASERREQVTEVLCVSAAGTGPRAARLSPANELGVLRARACAHSCPVPRPAKPRRWDTAYRPLGAEQSSFSSGCPSCRMADGSGQRCPCPGCGGCGGRGPVPSPGPERPRPLEEGRGRGRRGAAAPLPSGDAFARAAQSPVQTWGRHGWVRAGRGQRRWCLQSCSPRDAAPSPLGTGTHRTDRGAWGVDPSLRGMLKEVMLWLCFVWTSEFALSNVSVTISRGCGLLGSGVHVGVPVPVQERGRQVTVTASFSLG